MGSNVNDLLGVSCTSARSCQVGDHYSTALGTYRTLVESAG
jgi:hypothetical protein